MRITAVVSAVGWQVWEKNNGAGTMVDAIPVGTPVRGSVITSENVWTSVLLSDRKSLLP